MKRLLLFLLLLSPAIAGDGKSIHELVAETGSDASKLRGILRNATVVRHLPEHRLRSRPELFGWFLDRFHMTCRLVEHLEIEMISVEEGEEDGAVILDDGEGSIATVRCVHSGDGLRLFVTDGKLRIPLLPDVGGRALICVRYEAAPKKEKGLVARAEVHFQVKRRLLHRLGRIPFFRRRLGRNIDDRIGKVVRAADTISRIAEADPERLIQLAEKDDQLSDQQKKALKEKLTSGERASF